MMIKNFFKTAIVAIAVSATVTSSALAQEFKVRSINTQKVLQSFWRMKELNKELKGDETKIKKENNEKVAEITKLNDEILKIRKQLQDQNLPRNKREELTNSHKLKFNRLNNADRSRRDYIEGKIKALKVVRSTEQSTMLKEIKSTIDKYATENGLDMILDKGDGVGVVMYLKAKYDVTTAIIAIINKGHEDENPGLGKAPVPAPAGGNE